MGSELLVLNFDNVQQMSMELAQKVTEKPDLVVFVAKGAYLIGQAMAEYFNAPLLEIKAERQGNQLKRMIQPMLGYLPDGLKTWLHKKEIKAGIHARNTDRQVFFYIPEKLKEKDFKKILLVDDSIDTGNTILSAKAELEKVFPQAIVKTAAFFVFDLSKTVVKTDYWLYGDSIFSAPWSSDSRYYKEFISKYEKYKSEEDL